MSSKKEISENNKNAARLMLEKGFSVGKVARFLGVTKPTVLKALGLWDSDIQTMADGRQFKMVRGKIVRLGKKTAEEVPVTPEKVDQTIKELTTDEKLRKIGFEIP